MPDAFGAAIVIDNGSGFTKVGIAGGAPDCIVETVVGRPDRKGPLKARCRGMKDAYVGEHAQERRDLLTMSYPMEHGIIKNFDDMSEVWNYSFKELEVRPRDHPVFMSISPLTDKKDQKKIAEILFEKFHVQGVNLHDTLSLTHCSVQDNHAVIIDIGDSVTHVGYFVNRQLCDESVGRYEYGGRDVTNFLARNIHSTAPIKLEYIRRMKEKICYVAENFEQRLATATPALDKTCTINGVKTVIGTGQFRCPEALFTPSLLNIDAPGLHYVVYNSILTCDNTPLREELFKNIHISGGSAWFPGMVERLQKEIGNLVPELQVHVSKTRAPEVAAWMGASETAAYSLNRDIWSSRRDYGIRQHWFSCF